VSMVGPRLGDGVRTLANEREGYIVRLDSSGGVVVVDVVCV